MMDFIGILSRIFFFDLIQHTLQFLRNYEDGWEKQSQKEKNYGPGSDLPDLQTSIFFLPGGYIEPVDTPGTHNL